MPSINDFFPDKWLHAEHLQGKRPRVAVEAVNIETLFNPRTKKNEQKLVVAFHGKQLRLILNKTQARSLATICKTDDYSNWCGFEVVLSTGKAPNGADTILISPVPDAQPKPTPAPVADYDDLSGTIDPETGEIVDGDALFTKDAPANGNGKKSDSVSQAQLSRLAILVADVYGSDAKDQEVELVQAVSKGAVSRFKDLVQKEAQVLIGTLEKQLKVRQAEREAA